MLRWLLILLVLVGGLLVLQLGFVTVRPNEVAVVARGDRIVAVQPPGLRWHWPFIEAAEMIDVMRLGRETLRVSGDLADGSSCPVSLAVTSRVADPKRAFLTARARHKSAARQTQADPQSDAAVRLRENLATVMKTMTRARASDGAITQWLDRYARPIADDGTQIVAISDVAVGCAPPPAPPTQAAPSPPTTPTFGPPQAFARILPRKSAKAGEPVERFEMPESDLILADRSLVRVERLEVVFAISDAERFRQTFGGGERGTEIARARLGQMLAAELRRFGSEKNAADVPSFDPLEVMQGQDGKAAETLRGLGIEIIDMGGGPSRYRLVTRKRTP